MKYSVNFLDGEFQVTHKLKLTEHFRKTASYLKMNMVVVAWCFGRFYAFGSGQPATFDGTNNGVNFALKLKTSWVIWQDTDPKNTNKSPLE